jgi:hypothetical protein
MCLDSSGTGAEIQGNLAPGPATFNLGIVPPNFRATAPTQGNLKLGPITFNFGTIPTTGIWRTLSTWLGTLNVGFRYSKANARASANADASTTTST